MGGTPRQVYIYSGGSEFFVIQDSSGYHMAQGASSPLGHMVHKSTCEIVHINYDTYFARIKTKGLLSKVETKGYIDNLFEDEG